MSTKTQPVVVPFPDACQKVLDALMATRKAIAGFHNHPVFDASESFANQHSAMHTALTAASIHIVATQNAMLGAKDIALQTEPSIKEISSVSTQN